MRERARPIPGSGVQPEAGFQRDGALIDREGRRYLPSPGPISLEEVSALLSEARVLVFDACGCHDEWCCGAEWGSRAILERIRSGTVTLESGPARWVERWSTKQGRVAMVVNYRSVRDVTDATQHGEERL